MLAGRTGGPSTTNLQMKESPESQNMDFNRFLQSVLSSLESVRTVCERTRSCRLHQNVRGQIVRTSG
ncbi:hypothetical protein RMSM_00510 [Rhodopirellula maiorica SM1]|uniref:Uncharacterized protein n=1 Tax=Rhodopirellula maiorica SM1 TaxID=1265738 RepID=M5RT84_9BACT|nr:hypothetical protein RMSM_00510 [Rhodopirellula maiorica SM1]